MVLYDNFKHRFKIAKTFATTTSDLVELRCAAFDTQQSLEFLLKHILFENNVSYRKTHDIADLINAVKIVFDSQVFEELYKVANRITNWETRSRYDDSLLVDYSELRQAWDLIDKLHEDYLSWKNSNLLDFESVLQQYCSTYNITDPIVEIKRIQELCNSTDKYTVCKFIKDTFL